MLQNSLQQTSIDLNNDLDYQKYKNQYSVYFGYLILSNKLMPNEIKFIESRYRNWQSRVQLQNHL